MNKIFLSGTIGKDGEAIRKNDHIVLNTSLATHEWNGQETVTVWHQIVLFGKSAQNAEKLLKAGTNVTVFGRLSYNEYVDKQEIKRVRAEIKVEEFEVQKYVQDEESKTL